MRLETITINCHWLNMKHGSVCFSYGTPVALLSRITGTYYVDERWAKSSATTSKAINHFTNKKFTVVSSESFEARLSNLTK